MIASVQYNYWDKKHCGAVALRYHHCIMIIALAIISKCYAFAVLDLVLFYSIHGFTGSYFHLYSRQVDGMHWILALTIRLCSSPL